MSSTSQGRYRGLTLVIANLTKLTGVVVAVHEMLLRSTVRPGVLAEAAFMMAGAQFSEGVVLAALDRIMGKSDSDREVLPKEQPKEQP